MSSSVNSLFFRLMKNQQEFIPKLLTCISEGYSKAFFLNDLFAGITVGIISLPIAMAFAIASGVPPERGLFTAIVAGFFISLLGGSRVQIGGPTGAYVVVIYSVVQRHGYEGLVIATLMAGLMMIFLGISRAGILLKFIPYPVTTGFTAGIAVCIFSSQIKDFFGLEISQLPADFIQKWILYFKHAHTWNPWSFGLSLGTLASLFALRYYAPKSPGLIITIVIATALAFFFNLPVETIATKFGEIPHLLPEPVIPSLTLSKVQLLFPDAIAIALLGSIESLLSAVVADGMTGHRHRSNCELVAQGIANVGSSLFGGIPATGAIARTVANIKMHAKTPIAGIIHSITVLFLIFWFAPIAAMIPLPALGAILIFVAWNMSEFQHFAQILKGHRSEGVVLLMTFFLTILIDLTIAVQVGVFLAAILFIKRMSDSKTVELCQYLIAESKENHPLLKDSDIILRKDVPAEATVFEINGPFFFGVADSLNETLRQLTPYPKFFILRMHKVPLIDTTGTDALKKFHKRCQTLGITFILTGPKGHLLSDLQKTGVVEQIGSQLIFNHLDEALAYSKAQLEQKEISESHTAIPLLG